MASGELVRLPGVREHRVRPRSTPVRTLVEGSGSRMCWLVVYLDLILGCDGYCLRFQRFGHQEEVVVVMVAH